MVSLLHQRPERVAPPSDDAVTSLPPALAEALSPQAPSAQAAQPTSSPPVHPDPSKTPDLISNGTESGEATTPSTAQADEDGVDESPQAVLQTLRGLVDSLGSHERATMAPVLRELGLDQVHEGHTRAHGTNGQEQYTDLLSRMDAANDAADGLEAKLDRLLTSLDALLGDDDPGADEPQA